MRISRLLLAAISLLSCSSLLYGSTAANPQTADCLDKHYFQIRVIDSQTGRGVPLVELKTTNHLLFVTDSHGIAAIYEPGLMNTRVFFHVSSHGYEYPKDGFDNRGKAFELAPGGSATLEVKRINIAERLYRITGQGIYRDSLITGNPAPLAEPAINGLVMGQDSVQNCIYNGKLYWFWGDTARPAYPLGHFATAGAVSDLPGSGGLDPSIGVNLRYFTDENGFSRKMAPMSEPGMIWIDGVFAVTDSAGKQHMLAKHARMKSLGEAKERGLTHFNDQTQEFEPIVRCTSDHLMLNYGSGHPLRVKKGENRYYYFASPFPLSVRMRVRASWEHARDPNNYEILTSLSPMGPGKTNNSTPGPRWLLPADLLAGEQWTKSELIKALRKEKEEGSMLYDVKSGRAVKPHGGSVYWNKYRKKWIMITVQSGGDSSYLGEVWYAEADTPLGPWAYARKVVTHEKYTFYNPKQHPYFDQDGGRLIYFEGTYSYTFSGNPIPTPRYDYNQIMYRLDLADKRLALPEPVYEIESAEGEFLYLLGPQARPHARAGRVKNVPFYAVSPNRAYDGLIPLYAAKAGAIVTKPPAGSSKPIFFARPPEKSEQNQDNSITPLFEYVDATPGKIRYSTVDIKHPAWQKNKTPLCMVWKNPRDTITADWDAQPCPE